MKQLLIVDTSKKTIHVYDNHKLIKVIKNVWIGKNGTATFDKMFEGAMKTPLGLYNLGIAFGTNALKIKYPYIKIDEKSYWVDDSKSKYYNCFVEIEGNANNYNYPYIINTSKKDFLSAEHLIEYKKQYEYSVFIEYNINRIKEKGSAIFLHCHGDKGYTGGCIAIKRDDMKFIIRFLDKRKKPQIKIL